MKIVLTLLRLIDFPSPVTVENYFRCGKAGDISQVKPSLSLMQLSPFLPNAFPWKQGDLLTAPRPYIPNPVTSLYSIGCGWARANFCKQFLITQDIKKTLESNACTWKNLHGNKNT